VNDRAHPPAFALDGTIAGDADAEVAAHVESCKECQSYVEALSRAARAFTQRTEHDVGAFVARVATRAAAKDARPGVVPFRRRFARAAWIATPLVAAAALVLLIRRGDAPRHEPVASGSALVETRFKGALQLSVIRDRAGVQEKVSGEVRVRAGDRLRVDVAIDAEQPIVAGLLGNDGTWNLLLAPTLLEAGTHLSERAARFDDAPTEGVILAGPPPAVEAARVTRRFDGVAVLAVVRE
jgi:anti-sigma factor RsiW